jgi:hypothetical protein
MVLYYLRVVFFFLGVHLAKAFNLMFLFRGHGCCLIGKNLLNLLLVFLLSLEHRRTLYKDLM